MLVFIYLLTCFCLPAYNFVLFSLKLRHCSKPAIRNLIVFYLLTFEGLKWKFGSSQTAGKLWYYLNIKALWRFLILIFTPGKNFVKFLRTPFFHRTLGGGSCLLYKNTTNRALNCQSFRGLSLTSWVFLSKEKTLFF